MDGAGGPLAATVSAGQAHESRWLAPTLEGVRVPRAHGTGRPRVRPAKRAGDKAYGHPSIRRYLARRGIAAVIPTRKDQRANPRFARETYRRQATRHEKLAVRCLDVVHLAMIRRCLRLLNDPSNRT